MLESPAALLRAVAYLATLVAAGIALASASLRVVDAQVRALAVGTMRAGGFVLCLVAPAAAALFVVRLGGEWDGPTLGAVLQPPLGLALIAQLAGGAWFVLRARYADAVFAALLAVSAIALVGHAATNGRLTALALGFHIASMAWWVGGLWLLLSSLRTGSSPATADLLRSFSRQAPVVVVLALAAGIVTGGRILGWTIDPTSDYVLALGSKVVLALALLCAAAINRWAFSPGAGASFRIAGRLSTSIRLELALVAAALSVTAWLTTHLMPPEPAEPRTRIGNGVLSVVDPWVRATPPGASSAAAYLEIVNDGERSAALVSVTSAVAARIELHETRVVDGVARMRPIPRLVVPAHGSMRAEPAGLHVMLVGLSTPLLSGQEVPITFVFEGDRRIEATLRVVDSAASGDEHAAH